MQLHWRCAQGFLAQLVDMGGPASTTPGHLLEGVVSVGSATPLTQSKGSVTWHLNRMGLPNGHPLQRFTFDFGLPGC